jgi:hypothetical protein
MGRVETFLGTPVFNFIFTPIVFFFLLFICRAIFFTMLEMVSELDPENETVG